ncbi:Sorting nexin, cytoplasm-to-vacuole targeting pathway/endosomal sorting [Coemansia sp. RSA 2337]|nr:Sorting nexin, cytoplasm-to-vacuole targeting pathway/endosomal sorting [Coemansia sp. S3946]KAJ2054352.1 Sorting nexin, cytoplasm-to-vacuole targeting pathway/endosomal sorting [Coemansia sp. S16]KAJ2069569.1 Sorting nexin, cytoplasm-to-vacuole targeting pathway/endosomal sorting [Coemansia sp. S2]KAJ2116368.1 Sorting nexin, cytoplasm-to-vacuole targeting pathway/endosomal sorting [Coemansia sp. RSA 922]KAJ2468846.1 Sorting nexin, cytoplasm-to-vacuole targeting pathway/endosomal sorting [Co
MAEFGDYCCAIDRHVHELLDDANAQRHEHNGEQGRDYQPPQAYYVVHIGEAEKLSENGSSFIAYSIQFGECEVKRRYSEFESLRICLCRLYPTFIVPPIPEKHSLTQYAVLQKRAKEDQYIIERRKRMLEHFLNHLVEHPILSSEHILHRFLESGVSWTEVLHSPIVTGLPKSPLHSSPSRAPGSSLADGSAVQLPKIAATNSFASDVPVPSTLAPIKNIEARWMDCELFTNKYANHFSGVVERSERRIYHKLGELSGDYAELGATLNGFSLLEHPESLAAAIEKAGQAVDSSYIEINQLLRQMDAEVSEPIHEYAQYAMIIKQVLRFRLLKNLQMENAQEALVRQRAKLEGLLQADDEAKRLALALESSGSARVVPPSAQAGEVRRYADADTEHDSLMPPPAYDEDDSVAAQQRGFSTPQRASIDTASGAAGMSYAVAAGGRRSRGQSVGSGTSVGIHGDFTPTLAPQSIPEDSAFAPSSLGGRATQQRLRSRAGTATSTGSAGGRNRRGSAAAWSGRNGMEDDDEEADEEEEEDPLAQFQQEESQLWGGGTRSTLPRLGARSSRSQHHQQSGEEVFGAYPHMARSEYIGRANSPARNHPPMPSALPRHTADHQPPVDDSAAYNAKVMAASTPALRDHQHRESAYDDGEQQQRTHVATGMSASAVAPGPVQSSFGARLLRSPKVLGDGIMSRLTYALNGMMDVDPEQMRRNQIGRASDRIGILEEQLEMLSNDLVLINTSTQDNLDRFQKQKVRELKSTLIALAKMHLEWAEKNLEIWKEAKDAVDLVE